jgi:hypothetical protein
MSPTPNTKIRMFGFLDAARKAAGLPTPTEVYIPPDGVVAEDLARELQLPFDKIEGVFVNHFVYPLDKLIMPGDRVGFVSTGVPGPHRYSLGIHRAGKETTKKHE